jgi:hypothetical protein
LGVGGDLRAARALTNHWDRTARAAELAPPTAAARTAPAACVLEADTWAALARAGGGCSRARSHALTYEPEPSSRERGATEHRADRPEEATSRRLLVGGYEEARLCRSVTLPRRRFQPAVPPLQGFADERVPLPLLGDEGGAVACLGAQGGGAVGRRGGGAVGRPCPDPPAPSGQAHKQAGDEGKHLRSRSHCPSPSQNGANAPGAAAAARSRGNPAPRRVASAWRSSKGVS